MNVYITSTPEYPSEVAKEVALILNQTPGELEFISGDPLTVSQYSLAQPIMRDIKGIKKLSFNEFFKLCQTYRTFREISDDGYVVIITSIKNQKDWFSAFNGKNIFIYGEEWEIYTKRASKYGISYQVIENIFQSQIELDIKETENEPNIHYPSIGCINDMCPEKTDVMLKLRTADICESCLERAVDKNVNPLLLEQINRILRNLREEFVNAIKIESLVKPEIVFIDPEREVKIGKKEVSLDPLNKVLFIFFLKNLEGIETKLICEYKADLYEIYKEVRDNPDDKSIEKLVVGSNRNFEVVRSRLNRALYNQLGPKLAEYYILDRVEIKDSYNKYKINLDEEYITIKPPKRR